MMKTLVTLILMVFSLSGVMADSWYFEKQKQQDTFTFGQTEVIRVVDATENNQYPDYSVIILHEGNQEAVLKGLTFDQIVAFGEGKFLLGVSNSGLTDFAYFVIRSTGELLRVNLHHDNIHYCSQTATLQRVWVTEEPLVPEVSYFRQHNEFNEDEPYLFINGLKIKGCDGNMIELLSKPSKE